MRKLLLTALILLPAAALGQDPAPPAGTAAAEALVKLRGAKLLKRLTEPRYYTIDVRGRVQVIKAWAQTGGPALQLWLEVKRLDRPRVIRFMHEIGSDGRVKRIDLTQIRRPGTPKEYRRGVTAKIAQGKVIATQTGKGADPTPKESAWTDAHVGAVMLWFVLPSLFDQGLPRKLSARVIKEESLARGTPRDELVEMVRSEKPHEEDGRKVYTFTVKGPRETATATVAADGPDKGQVLAVMFAPGMGFKRITAKEAAQLEQDAPLLKNEAAAMRVLRSLHDAQRTHQRQKSTFAKDLEPLEKEDSYLAKALEALQKTHLVVMRASPDGKKWMALAVPTELGKTGRHYLVINQDGTIHKSAKKIELDDSCSIPAGATPVK